jgi:hypothetical protein
LLLLLLFVAELASAHGDWLDRGADPALSDPVRLFTMSRC